MSSAIQNLIEKTIGDGARSTKYTVSIPFIGNDTMLCKSATAPEMQHQPIEIKRYGRSIPIQGQNKFTNTWSCTFYADSSHKLRQKLLTSMEYGDNVSFYSANTSTRNVGEIYITQLDFDSNEAAKYTLHNCFVTEVGALQYSSEGAGEILEFSATFSYSHFTIKDTKSKGKNAVDTFVGGIMDKLPSAGKFSGII